jgi:hypothetical protein
MPNVDVPTPHGSKPGGCSLSGQTTGLLLIVWADNWAATHCTQPHGSFGRRLLVVWADGELDSLVNSGHQSHHL